MFSKNKGADQLCSYCRADLRLCFLQWQKSGFLVYMYFQMSNGDVTASFSLVDDEETRKMWNHRYDESVKQAQGLCLSLMIH